MPGDQIDQTEKVGIQWRLVEHVVADPVAAGDPLRPLVVAARIANEDVEKRRTAHLEDVDEPKRKRHGEDHDIHKAAMLAHKEPQRHEDTKKAGTKSFDAGFLCVFVSLWSLTTSRNPN